MPDEAGGSLCDTIAEWEEGEGGARGRGLQNEKPDAAGEQGEQACVPALLEFLGMVPELVEVSEEDAPGSVLAGCEHDCKHLAFKALILLQQVAIRQFDDCHDYHSSTQLISCHMLYQEQAKPS